MRIGWIGTGTMGRHMARRLMDAGHSLTVHDRFSDSADGLVQRGATWADSPQACVANNDVVFTMLAMPIDVESVYLGADGLLAGAAEGTTFVEMTTSSPSLATRLGERGAELGVHVIDAPVSGGPVGAQDGTLSIMVGGDEQVFERSRPLLSIVGSTVVHHGDCGAGQVAKLVNQVLIAGVMAGIAEAFVLVEQLGLDPERVFQSVARGAAGSWLLDWAWPKLMAGDMGPGFKVDHFIKDLTLVADLAADAGMSLEMTELVSGMYKQIAADGSGGGKGTQALVEAVPTNADHKRTETP